MFCQKSSKRYFFFSEVAQKYWAKSRRKEI